MKKYLKYANCNFLVSLSIVSFLAGGHWLWLPLLTILAISIGGDAFLDEDKEFSSFSYTWILNSFLYLNLPLLLLANFLFFWHVSDYDVFGFGKTLQALGLWSPDLVKARTSAIDLLGAFMGLGLLFGIAGTNVAHELVHRTWSVRAMETGRWLLAFTWDAAFAIEHVYGHHRNIATFVDPASARRGENTYAFLIRSTLGSNRSAWTIEQRFLQRQGHSLWSWHNRLLRGWSYSLALAAFAFLAAGYKGLLVHIVLSLYGKAYLELVNFIEHYGLVRVPKSPVEFRHSWNSNAPISSWYLYNLTRHSHHHETGHLPFWRLQPKTNAPRLPYGYMTMILIALVPPLFRSTMAAPLARWDQEHAKPAELALLSSLGRYGNPLESKT